MDIEQDNWNSLKRKKCLFCSNLPTDIFYVLLQIVYLVLFVLWFGPNWEMFELAL